MPFFGNSKSQGFSASQTLGDSTSVNYLFETSSDKSSTDGDTPHHPHHQRDTSMLTFSFAAAGWLQVYLFGCCHALIQNVPGVRVEGLNDSYQEYMDKMKEASDSSASQQQRHAFTNKFDSTQDLSAVEEGLSATKTQQQEEEEQQRRIDGNRLKFIGSSAGSLASAAILLGTDMEEMLEYAVECVNYCHQKWYHAFQLRYYVERGIAKFAIDIFKNNKDEDGSSSKKKKNSGVINNIKAANNNKKRRRGSQVPKEGGQSILEKIDQQDQKEKKEDKDDGDSESTATDSSIGDYDVDDRIFEEEEDDNNNKDNNNSAAPADPTSPTTLAEGSNQFLFVSEEDKQHGLKKMQDRKDFLGSEGGWVGKEFFFPKHIREQLGKRLEVYATSLPWIQEICFDDFESTMDLEEALVASCLLTPLAGLPFKLRKQNCFVMDGGLRSFQPRKGQPGVITISAMYFNAADIRPSVFVPAWWGLYPPSEAQYRELFKLGHNDMLNWLWKHRLIPLPGSDAEMESKLMKYTKDILPKSHEAWWGYILDFFAAIFYLGLLRPFAMIAIYAEMWFVTILSFVATVFHEFFPRTFDFLIGTRSLRARRAGGRLETWQDFWNSLRNLTSPRTWLHLAVGYRSVNSRRLQKYSRLYRVFRPFVASEHHHHHHHRDKKEKKE